MEERVHVSSWPIGRDFTFGEWCDYLKAHPNSASEPVADFDGWKFNVHGVCVNRATPVKMQVGGASFDVQLYKAPRGRKLGEPLAWNFSVGYSDGIGGGSGGFDEVEGDDRDAIVAGLHKVIQRFEQSAEWNRRAGYDGRVAACQRAIEAARQEIEKRQQLTLFD